MSVNSHGLAAFVNAMACNARVLGMQAENSHRQACGNSPAYGEDAFNIEARVMDEYATQIRENGWQS